MHLHVCDWPTKQLLALRYIALWQKLNLVQLFCWITLGCFAWGLCVGISVSLSQCPHLNEWVGTYPKTGNCVLSQSNSNFFFILPCAHVFLGGENNFWDISNWCWMTTSIIIWDFVESSNINALSGDTVDLIFVKPVIFSVIGACALRQFLLIFC